VRRPTASVSALSFAAIVAFGFGACGDEDAQLLPGGTAREITANLETVERLADEGDCLGAEGAALQVSEQVEALRGVDTRLKRALSDGADRLNEVVASCEEEAEASEPLPVPDEVETDEEEDLEKDQEKAEKQEEKEQEQEEKEEEDEDGEGEEGPPSLPPQAEGEGKGVEEENENGPSSGEGGGGGSSGGVSPANPAGKGG